jgi:DNA-binding Lrp family transcriptional regulator
MLLTQQGLPLTTTPYHDIAEQLGISLAQTLEIARSLQQRKIIRRIAAVPNHYQLGYRFNGMTVWNVIDEQAIHYGQQVGALPFVSHCYLRPRHLPLWPYNLFAMIHAKNQQQLEQYRIEIKQLLAPVLQNGEQPSNDMLLSQAILKKTGLRLKQS